MKRFGVVLLACAFLGAGGPGVAQAVTGGWSAPVQLADWLARPNVGIADDGTVTAITSENSGVQAATLAPGSNTLEHVQQLSGPNEFGVSAFSEAGNGAAVVVWETSQGSDPVLHVAIRRAGAAEFGPGQVITYAGVLDHPTASVNEAGDVVVGWKDFGRRALMVSVGTTTGGLAPPEAVEQEAPGGFSELLSTNLDEHGDVLATWGGEDAPGHHSSSFRFKPTGQPWGPETPMRGGRSLGPDGTVVTTWTIRGQDGAASQHFVKIKRPGVGWGPDIPLGEEGIVGTRLAPDGTLWTLLSSRQSGDLGYPALQARVAPGTSLALGPPFTLPTNDESVALLDGYGNLIAVGADGQAAPTASIITREGITIGHETLGRPGLPEQSVADMAVNGRGAAVAGLITLDMTGDFDTWTARVDVIRRPPDLRPPAVAVSRVKTGRRFARVRVRCDELCHVAVRARLAHHRMAATSAHALVLRGQKATVRLRLGRRVRTALRRFAHNPTLRVIARDTFDNRRLLTRRLSNR